MSITPDVLPARLFFVACSITLWKKGSGGSISLEERRATRIVSPIPSGRM
jgi:hypothetical protein